MTDSVSPARLRVAPSPTGEPHVGTAYMSLFNLAYARKTGGQFILRIEDTDRARYVADAEQQIFDTLSWLGLHWDEGPDIGGPYGPYRQSERLEVYRPFVDRLLESGHAYHCWCTPERLANLRQEQQKAKVSTTGYDRCCHGLTRQERAALPGFQDEPVVRMLIPEDVELEFDDLIRGRVHAPRPDDQVIMKADGYPTYHLAVVVDDYLMKITHVVRGEEWISSTPKHLLLCQWLGIDPPKYAHMPLLRNVDRSKISKRKNPAARLTWFVEEGYLPEALRNFLQLLAYPPVDDAHEVSTFEEFVEHFDWAKVNTVGPIFDLKKLNWLNGHYLRSLDNDELVARIVAYAVRSGQWPAEPDPVKVEMLRRAGPLIQERITLLQDALPMLGFLFAADDDVVVAADVRSTLPAESADILTAAGDVLRALESFTHDSLQNALRARLVDEMGIKPRVAFAPVRAAITGQRVSPPLFELMEILGQKSVLARLQRLGTALSSEA